MEDDRVNTEEGADESAIAGDDDDDNEFTTAVTAVLTRDAQKQKTQKKRQKKRQISLSDEGARLLLDACSRAIWVDGLSGVAAPDVLVGLLPGFDETQQRAWSQTSHRRASLCWSEYKSHGHSAVSQCPALHLMWAK